jgi:ABC-type transport system substrate-binding protein
MMLNGESDVAFGVAAEDVWFFRDTPENFTLFEFTHNSPICIGFNMNDPLMADWHFRMAVMYAINKEEVASVVSSAAGAGTWRMQAPSDGNVWGYNTQTRRQAIPLIPYDPDRARDHLAESRYNGRQIDLVAAGFINVLAAEVITWHLWDIGINVVLVEMDFAPFVRDFGEHPMNVAGLSFGLGAWQSAFNIFHPDGRFNWPNYDNLAVTNLIDRARTEISEMERRNLLTAVQELVADDPPYMSLYWHVSGAVASKGVGGIVLSSAPARHDLRGIYKLS